MLSISGFTYVRNGFQYGYPFLASIRSLLPLVTELVVVVGDSVDGTREAIAGLNDPKIKIIDVVWDEDLRRKGTIFAQQSNMGLDAITGDWAIHLQADEVWHQRDLERLKAAILNADNNKEIEGLLFPFYHFWGDYRHIRNTRKVHPFEIRAFRNSDRIRSYKDSQGFRKYSSRAAYAAGEPGEKLKVLKTDIPVYHYSYSRHPALMSKKADYFHRFWHSDEWVKQNITGLPFDFNDVDQLELFEKDHPVFMKEIIAAQDWSFQYDPSRSNQGVKDKLIEGLNRLLGKRLFEYQNYRLIKQ